MRVQPVCPLRSIGNQVLRMGLSRRRQEGRYLNRRHSRFSPPQVDLSDNLLLQVHRVIRYNFRGKTQPGPRHEQATQYGHETYESNP